MPSNCPHCGSELILHHETMTPLRGGMQTEWDCGTWKAFDECDGQIRRHPACRIREAVALCERYSAGNEPGAHALANKVREILTGERREYV